MYCDCTSYHAQCCIADAYHIPIEQAIQRYLLCLCDCHEDGWPVTEQEWDEVQAVSTRLLRPAPIHVHPFLSASVQLNRNSSPATRSEEARDSFLLLPPTTFGYQVNASLHQK